MVMATDGERVHQETGDMGVESVSGLVDSEGSMDFQRQRDSGCVFWERIWVMVLLFLYVERVGAADCEERIGMGQKDIRWRRGAFPVDERRAVG
jgi:hypothetical protein